MGVRARNLKNLFADARTRTIFIITAVILLLGIILGYYIFREKITLAPTTARLQTAPGIQAIPGAFNPTEQYARLLEQQNLEQAQRAEKTGKSAIPTIIRVTKPGEGQLETSPQVGQPWQAGLGFKQLTQVEENGSPKSLALQNLRKSSCARAFMQSARQQGATINDLLNAGCTARQLLDAGYTPQQLQQSGVSACDLLNANGFDPTALKKAGYTAGELRGVGFNACQLKRANYSPAELRQAGFSPAELKGVGFSPEQIQQAGYTTAELAGAPVSGLAFPGLHSDGTIASILQGGCNPGALRQDRQAGISATTIREVLGCSAAQLKAGGYTGRELRNAGFTAAELKNAGFSPEEIKDAGYSTGDLLMAGLNPADLANLKYSPAEIQAGVREANALSSPLGLDELRKRDCTPSGLAQDHAQGISASVLRQLGCTAAQLRAAGYTATELKNAGFTAAELRNAGFSLQDLKNAGFTAAQLRNAGFTAAELRNAGFTPSELRNAGFSAQQLRDAGGSLNDLKGAGFSAQDLRNAGFSAADLRGTGFSPTQLKDAGFSPEDLKNAGFSANQLRAAGISASQLRTAGFSAADVRGAGFTASDLREAGFNPTELRDAGFSAQQLRAAGVTPSELQAAGYTRNEIANAGFTPDQLSAAGITTALTPTISRPGVPGLTPQQEQLQRVLDQQQEQLRQQQLQQLQQQIQSAMTTQAGQLFNAWKPVKQALVEGEEPKITVASAAAAAAAEAAAEAATAPTIKAGTIMFGILETAINSDEPGPVLATIVAGPLKGARLIGSLTTFGIHGGRVMVTFETLTTPDYPQSIKIDAVAIDPNTARTGLSSHTNYHFIEKWGGYFAASFLEGYGQAFLQSGQVVVSTNGNVIAQSPNLSPSGKLYVALGNVGNQFGSELQDKVLSRNPTVYVYSGTSVGILFLGDVTLPTDITIPATREVAIPGTSVTVTNGAVTTHVVPTP